MRSLVSDSIVWYENISLKCPADTRKAEIGGDNEAYITVSPGYVDL